MVRARSLNGDHENLTSGPLELAFLGLQDPGYDLIDGGLFWQVARPVAQERSRYGDFRHSERLRPPLGSQRKCVLDTLLPHKP